MRAMRRASHTTVVVDGLQDASPGLVESLLPPQEWQIEKQKMRCSRPLMSDLRMRRGPPGEIRLLLPGRG